MISVYVNPFTFYNNLLSSWIFDHSKYTTMHVETMKHFLNIYFEILNERLLIVVSELWANDWIDIVRTISRLKQINIYLTSTSTHTYPHRLCLSYIELIYLGIGWAKITETMNWSLLSGETLSSRLLCSWLYQAHNSVLQGQ